MWLVVFWRRLPPGMWAVVRARMTGDPRQLVRLILTVATLALGLPIGVYELTHPERPDTGDRVVMGLLGGVCWLLLAGVVIVTIDVRQARRRAASPEESGSFGTEQHATIQTGRLTLRWFRATAVLAILPSSLAAQPAEPWTTRAPGGTAVLAVLALYYAWTVRRWRRRPGIALTAGVAHLVPLFYFGLSVLWMATVAAAYWPGEPPSPTSIGMLLGALVVVFHLFWLPIRAIRAVVSTDRR